MESAHPPKIKHFLRWALRLCLPIRERLISIGVNCPSHCSLCSHSWKCVAYMHFSHEKKRNRFDKLLVFGNLSNLRLMLQKDSRNAFLISFNIFTRHEQTCSYPMGNWQKRNNKSVFTYKYIVSYVIDFSN